MKSTTPGVIKVLKGAVLIGVKVPKGAVFIRVNKHTYIDKYEGVEMMLSQPGTIQLELALEKIPTL